MSAEALPISLSQFTTALETLPLGNLYAKVLELRNSVLHLERSNDELQTFSVEVGGDRDCDEAVQENEGVIVRMKERIELIKAEVEKRGHSWHEVEEAGKLNAAEAATMNGHQDDNLAQIPEVNGTRRNGRTGQEHGPEARPGSPPRLTDDQLRELVLAQINNDEDEEGVHL